jgi:hypothetical protein
MPERTGRQCGNEPAFFKLAPTPARSGYSGLSLAARVIRRGARLGSLTRVAERQQNLREDEFDFGQR